ncbi:MAG TPA: peptidylprolyl isomerase [Bacilli bacterium]|nr:peptidylprolyl isomerase [Bacilli bacterium]
MKNKINEKQIKVSLLCVGMVVVGIALGMFIDRPRTIPTLKNGEDVIAKLDGKDFTAKDLYTELKTQGGSTVLLNLIDQYIASKEIKDTKAADEYAKSYLENVKAQYASYGYDFANALTEAGYADEDTFLKAIAKDHLLTLTAEKYIKANMISKDEINSYYDSDIVGSMHARYILITPETKDDMTDEEKATKKAEALKEANEVIEKLKNGEDFATLAKKHSDDSTTASQGGLYDGFTKSDVVNEFWNACANLEDGKYTTSPVESSYGYFIITRISQDEKPALDKVKDDVLDAVLKQKETDDTELITKAWKEIRKSYNLDIIDSDIKSSYEK